MDLFHIVVFLISILISLGYVLLLIRMTDGWNSTKMWNISPTFVPTTKVSVIVPIRNEANCIELCLNSILQNEYPADLLEIIVVNDHSDDHFLEVLQKWEEKIIIINLDNHETGKKTALHKGICQAHGELILCTDGDCEVPFSWIRIFAHIYEQTGASFLAGLVRTKYENTVLDAFQFLDFGGAMMATAYGINTKRFYMANGANMAFKKEAYFESSGMLHGKQLASGDDMFLVQTIASKGGQIVFVRNNEAAILTRQEKFLSSLLSQRRRWATKSKFYQTKGIYIIQAFMATVYVVILINLILIPWSDGLSLFTAVFMIFIKWIMDYLFLSIICRHYKYKDPLKYFLPSVLIHFFLYGYMSVHAIWPSAYMWKGRKVR